MLIQENFTARDEVVTKQLLQYLREFAESDPKYALSYFGSYGEIHSLSEILDHME